MNEQTQGIDTKTALSGLLLVLVIAGGAWLYLQGPLASEGKLSLALGESKTAEGITIGLTKLVEDSRCPVDVQCIQAGTVRVEGTVNDLKRLFVFALNEPQQVEGKVLTLIDVEPGVKQADTTVVPSEYHFTFSVGSPPQLMLYTNELLGLSFQYPGSYVIRENEVGNAERGHFVVTLVPEGALPLPEAGEGPPAITIEVFQNIESYSLMDWLRGSSASNFKLSDGTYVEATIGTVPAVAYSWSGLYATDSLAFLHRGHIFFISAGYITAEDTIRTDFLNLLASLRLN
jgi:hypothetical protein